MKLLHRLKLESDERTPGSILPEADAAREGMDFPGDGVSLLVIPRLGMPYSYSGAMVRVKHNGNIQTKRSSFAALTSRQPISSARLMLQKRRQAMNNLTSTQITLRSKQSAGRNGLILSMNKRCAFSATILKNISPLR